MDDTLRRDVRILKAYALVTSTVLALLVLAASQGAQRKPDARQHFGEIDVERINIVERDGTPRFIFSNKARFPGIIVHGKEYPHPSRKTAGMLWFSDEGTENGGLTAGVEHGPDGTTASGLLTFDQYDQDQTVGLRYDEHNGQRSAGLQVWDRPDYPIERILDALRLPNGPEKTRRLDEFKKGNATRLYAGKTPDRAAVVQLADPQGRPRLRLSVDSAGIARVEFLDENGRVTSTLPSK
jgi:hypothetical protein